MTWTSVVIPLISHDNKIRGKYRTQCRCYPHQDMVALLESIAGTGDAGLWWTEDEAHMALSRDNRNWVWVPTGDLDLEVDEYWSNRQTHMKIFFREPAHAVLFRLSWL